LTHERINPSVGIDVHRDTLRLYALDKDSGQPVDTPFTVPDNRYRPLALQLIFRWQGLVVRRNHLFLER
jgi:hypothetical protein